MPMLLHKGWVAFSLVLAKLHGQRDPFVQPFQFCFPLYQKVCTLAQTFTDPCRMQAIGFELYVTTR